MLPFLLAEKVVPAVGRVLAYSDNKVHAVFYDGVILTMMWDFRICDGQSEVSHKGSSIPFSLTPSALWQK